MKDLSFPTPSVLDFWFSKKPTLALMGEFSAGKSTLLNLILADDVLQTRVTATSMPVVWLTYADEIKAESLSRDGTLTEFDVEEMGADGQKDQLAVRLSLPNDVLKRIDIIDTPGISDSRLAKDALSFLGPYLDAAIWCTAANQAWRQTEKAMWMTQPEQLRQRSVLALTRADTLRKKGDLDKVLGRCTRETDGLFAQVLPISAIAALQARDDDGNISNPSDWEASYAPAFFDQMNSLVEAAEAECKARETLEYPEPTPISVSMDEEVMQEAPKQAQETVKKKPLNAAPKGTPSDAKTVSSLRKELCQLSVTPSQNEHFFVDLHHILNAFSGNKALSEGQQMVLDHTMSLDPPNDVPKKPLVAQLIRELDDFANSIRCELDKTN